MRFIAYALVIFLFVPLIIGNCSSGSAPETVVVPVGEPGEGDPYDTQGDLGCGSDTGAVDAALVTDTADPRVIVTFAGTEDIWIFSITVPEFDALQIDLGSLWTPEELAALGHEDVDALHDGLCAPPEDRPADVQALYEILSNVLADSLPEMTLKSCD